MGLSDPPTSCLSHSTSAFRKAETIGAGHQAWLFFKLKLEFISDSKLLAIDMRNELNQEIKI
jgi:hypothetical protein